MIEKRIFFDDCNKFILKNELIEVHIIEYGATIVSFKVKNSNDEMTDIVLGYDTLADYKKNDGYFGAIIGRYGNRINKGKFYLNNQEFQLFCNNGKHHLHGGKEGFDQKIWNGKVENEKLIMSYTSLDMEENYPGTLRCKVIYSLVDNFFKIDYQAETDADTIINLTNHSYFNLNGHGNGNILNHYLKINSQFFTPVNQELIPNGLICDVKNTPLDFRDFKKIEHDIYDSHEQLIFGKGYDHNFALNKEQNEMGLCAEVYSDITKIKMKVETDQPGVQFYTGNFLTKRKGKENKVYDYREGFCLETQHYPNSINIDDFPSVVLKKGDIYRTTTIYSFSNI